MFLSINFTKFDIWIQTIPETKKNVLNINFVNVVNINVIVFYIKTQFFFL